MLLFIVLICIGVVFYCDTQNEKDERGRIVREARQEGDR